MAFENNAANAYTWMMANDFTTRIKDDTKMNVLENAEFYHKGRLLSNDEVRSIVETQYAAHTELSKARREGNPELIQQAEEKYQKLMEDLESRAEQDRDIASENQEQVEMTEKFQEAAQPEPEQETIEYDNPDFLAYLREEKGYSFTETPDGFKVTGPEGKAVTQKEIDEMEQAYSAVNLTYEQKIQKLNDIIEVALGDGTDMEKDEICAKFNIDPEHYDHIAEFIANNTQYGITDARTIAAFEVVRQDIEQNAPEGFDSYKAAESWAILTQEAADKVEDLTKAWQQVQDEKDKAQSNVDHMIEKRKSLLTDIADLHLQLAEAPEDAKKEIEEMIGNAQKQIVDATKDVQEAQQALLNQEKALREATIHKEAALLVQSLPIGAEQAEKNRAAVEAGIEDLDHHKEEVIEHANDWQNLGGWAKKVQIGMSEFAHTVGITQAYNEIKLRHEFHSLKRDDEASYGIVKRIGERFKSWENRDHFSRAKAEHHANRARGTVRKIERTEKALAKVNKKREKAAMRQLRREYRQNGQLKTAKEIRATQEYKDAVQERMGFLGKQLQKRQEVLKDSLKKDLHEIATISKRRQEVMRDIKDRAQELKDFGDLRAGFSFKHDLSQMNSTDIARANNQLRNSHSQTVREAVADAHYFER